MASDNGHTDRLDMVGEKTPAEFLGVIRQQAMEELLAPVVRRMADELAAEAGDALKDAEAALEAAQQAKALAAEATTTARQHLEPIEGEWRRAVSNVGDEDHPDAANARERYRAARRALDRVEFDERQAEHAFQQVRSRALRLRQLREYMAGPVKVLP